jgi:hypothetical protein
VAKLSADNIVLLVKLRKADARAAGLAEEVSTLRAAVESQSGAWFADVHAAVERATRDGMLRADALQVRSPAALWRPASARLAAGVRFSAMHRQAQAALQHP